MGIWECSCGYKYNLDGNKCKICDADPPLSQQKEASPPIKQEKELPQQTTKKQPRRQRSRIILVKRGSKNPPPQNTHNLWDNNDFLVGAGIYDITGPAAELGTAGYGIGVKTTGIHTRLYSRAFIIGDSDKRVVYVSAELLFITPPLSLGVLEKLQQTYGELYTKDNVMLTATHTHSGPGGYCGYALYDIGIGGFDKQNYNAIVNGIYQSIVRAHNSLAPGRMKINQGDLDGVSMNRSEDAYNKNEDRVNYEDNIDKKMLLLRLEGMDGKEIGMINWFAVHPTNIGNKNKLISSDNKGYASFYFEKSKKTDYLAENTFVGAFAQSNAGDVSPNLWGHPDGKHDYERMEIIGNKLLDKANKLYDNASTCLSGSLDYRHTYLDFSMNGPICKEGRACVAAIGAPIIGGAEADGIGKPVFEKLIVFVKKHFPNPLSSKDDACHKEKVIALHTGRMLPHPWTPDILPAQIIKIGSLALVGLPVEATTMAGRRIRNAVQAILSEIGVDNVVFAGYANSYCGYITTAQEYAVQNYEGGHTLFGPNSETVFREEAVKLAQGMRDGTDISSATTLPDIRGKTILSLIPFIPGVSKPGVIMDDKPPSNQFGSLRTNPKEAYNKGETVSVAFWGGHPKNNLRTQGTFLEIQKKVGDAWQTIARDNDPKTRYIWSRNFIAYSSITIEWDIPQDAEAGEYKIIHHGNWKSISQKISEYRGESATFTVN
ncbi:MAG: neutral/alkaline ceramidase [Planctomycetota bacterium]|jgi:neutral ceramidase